MIPETFIFDGKIYKLTAKKYCESSLDLPAQEQANSWSLDSRTGKYIVFVYRRGKWGLSGWWSAATANDLRYILEDVSPWYLRFFSPMVTYEQLL